MEALLTPASSVHGTLTLPADKAICHRAALLCSLTTGATEIQPWSTAEDCRRTLDALRGLGVSITQTAAGIRIEGVGLRGLREPAGALDCGDSGTTMRLTCGLLAGQPFASRLTAGPSLSRRPMRRIVEPLSRMGASIHGAAQSSGEVCPPLVIEGRRPLRGITYEMPVASAQVKSAILLAGLFADGPTTVVEPVPTRDHTERCLRLLGLNIRSENRRMTLTPPPQGLSAPGTLAIPGDPSSAAFFLVAASVIPHSDLIIQDVCVNPTRVYFLEVLKRMHACVSWDAAETGWEPRATVTVESRALRGTTIEPREVPRLIDELPILMVAACAAEGETRFRGIQELKVKETDRLQSMIAGLQAMGAHIETDGADVRMTTSRLHGAVVDGFGDHRTAMSLAVAGLIAEGQTRIRGAECVAKSLGNFFELLASVAGSSSVHMETSAGD